MQQNRNFIKFIYEATPKQRKKILYHITKDQISLISEIALNIIKGIFPNTSSYVKTLKPYKSIFVRLSSKREANKHKRELLLRFPKLLPLLIKPALGHI